MLISVVVPISSAQYIPRLKACLNSVREQSYPQEDIEILVTLLKRKEPSTSEEKEYLVRFCGDYDAELLEYVHNDAAWPPSLSRNVGYRRAKGDILVSLDADGVLHRGTFQTAVGWMNTQKCAVRVRTSLVPKPPGDPLFFKLEPEDFNRSVELGKKAPGPGCCILTPREAVETIRGWDEAYVGYGPADWDFVERIEKAGWPVVNLSESNRIWTLHQDHERILGTPLQHKNRAYHARSKLKTNPVRNKKGWGGFR
ncbi:MAG: glycosyltransferase family 2 protein [Planctomycetota bacterium]|jgi:glycosyltransferase involved in cell wall biosynthesis